MGWGVEWLAAYSYRLFVLALVAFTVVAFFFLKSVKNGGIALLEQGNGQTGEVAAQAGEAFPSDSTSPSPTSAAFASFTATAKEYVQRGRAELNKGTGEVMKGLSAAKDAAQAQLKLNDLKGRLVAAYRSLGDAADQAEWNSELCTAIKQRKQEVAVATAQHSKAATDAELAKNTPGAGAAKQAFLEAKRRMLLAAGVLDGLRERAGRALLDDVSAPPHIGAEQRAEIARLMEAMGECESVIAHGKKSLVSKPMLVAAVILVVSVFCLMLFLLRG